MNATRSLRLALPLAAEECAHGDWCLCAGATTVYLRSSARPDALGEATGASLQWPAGGGAQLRLLTPRGEVLVAAASVQVHKPLPGLYEALPLARFEAAQQRFWRRVFLLVRLPGARLLLRWIAAKSR